MGGSCAIRVFNRNSEKEKRRQLRKSMPAAEALLWSKIRAKRLLGRKFRRQYSVGPYVVDFYCPELKLAVEVDGDSHFQPGALEKDQRRQAFIESFDIKFLRFTNEDVTRNTDGVLDVIRSFMVDRDPPSARHQV